MWFPNRFDPNRPVRPQKMARSLKFRIKEEEKLYHPCNENKGADQLRRYCEADLRLSFRIYKMLVYLQCGSFIIYCLFSLVCIVSLQLFSLVESG